MATYTTNYNLKKPGYGDAADVADINENMEIIDGQMHTNATAVIPVNRGGTGETTVAAARNALGLGNTDGALPVENGGTGQTTVAAARNALGLGNTDGALPIANGGTGKTTVAAARNALGLGNTSGALPIANGGTGQTTVAAARNAMGLGNTDGALPVANGGTGATGVETSADVTAKGITAKLSRFGKVVTVQLSGSLTSAISDGGTILTITAGYRPKVLCFPMTSRGDRTTDVLNLSTAGILSARYALAKNTQLVGTITYVSA